MSSTSGELTLLIADDNEKNLRLLQMTLKQLDCRLLVCKDGEEALKAYIAEKPDLVILDALMPKMDGFTVCRRMREHDLGKYVPIIISSAFYKGDVYEHEAAKIGADEFLPKPLSPQQLLHTVKNLLDREQG